MPITVILELRLKPESVPAARDLMRRALQDTRAFDGNLGIDVLVDEDDEAHWLIYERWETVEHEEAYRTNTGGATPPDNHPAQRHWSNLLREGPRRCCGSTVTDTCTTGMRHHP